MGLISSWRRSIRDARDGRLRLGAVAGQVGAAAESSLSALPIWQPFEQASVQTQTDSVRPMEAAGTAAAEDAARSAGAGAWVSSSGMGTALKRTKLGNIPAGPGVPRRWSASGWRGRPGLTGRADTTSKVPRGATADMLPVAAPEFGEMLCHAENAGGLSAVEWPSRIRPVLRLVIVR